MNTQAAATVDRHVDPSAPNQTPEVSQGLDAYLLEIGDQIAATLGISVSRLNQLGDEAYEVGTLVVAVNAVHVGARCPQCELRRNSASHLTPAHAQKVHEQAIWDLIEVAMASPEVAADLWVLLDPEEVERIARRSGCCTDHLVGAFQPHLTRYRQLLDEGIRFTSIQDGWIVDLNACRCAQ